MSTGTFTENTTFTISHARHIAAKVATDLKRMQRFYGAPSDSWIASYEAEMIVMLKGGYLDTVTYGFDRNGSWIVPTLYYSARELAGGSADDDDPGRIPPNADVTGASFYSYLTYSAAWRNLSAVEKILVEAQLPFKRVGAEQPGVNGYLVDDKTYSAGGRALNRKSVRGW